MKTLSYSEVLWEVQLLAGVLRHKLGVRKGDRVIIYVSSFAWRGRDGADPVCCTQMPMITEGAIAMLACARIG